MTIKNLKESGIINSNTIVELREIGSKTSFVSESFYEIARTYANRTIDSIDPKDKETLTIWLK